VLRFWCSGLCIFPLMRFDWALWPVPSDAWHLWVFGALPSSKWCSCLRVPPFRAVWVLLLGVGDDSSCFFQFRRLIGILLFMLFCWKFDRIRRGRLAAHLYQFTHHLLLSTPFPQIWSAQFDVFAINLSLVIWQLLLFRC
jgi:hypothetical protein